MHEINEAAIFDAAKQRAIRPGYFDLVPPDLRHLKPVFPRKPNHVPLKNPQPRGATVEFLTALEECLVTDADAQKRAARLDVSSAGFQELLPLHSLNTVIERTNSRQNNSPRAFHVARLLRNANVSSNL